MTGNLDTKYNIKTIKKILKQNDFISFLCRHKRLCVRLYMAKETRNSSTGTITWTGNSIWAIVCYLIWLWHSIISFHAHTTSNKKQQQQHACILATLSDRVLLCACYNNYWNDISICILWSETNIFVYLLLFLSCIRYLD